MNPFISMFERDAKTVLTELITAAKALNIPYDEAIISITRATKQLYNSQSEGANGNTADGI